MATGVTGFPAALDTDATLLVQVNDCSSLLSSSINATDTSLTVSNASSFPSAGILRIDDEFVKWDSKSTNTLNSLTRGAYGSTAASHAAAAEVRLTVMAGYHNVLKDAVIAVETKLGTGSSTPTSGKALMGSGTGTSSWQSLPVELVVACSDESTALTTGAGKVTFRMPHAMTLTAVRASLTTAQTSGSIFTVDINEAGSTILSTKLTIDNGEKTSTTAATAAVISDSALADDAEITVDIDQVGDGTAKGLKIVLIGVRG